LGFSQLALAASCGAARLQVFRRPQVAILTTGDELVSIEEVPPPGHIRNSNGVMLAEMVRKSGGEPWLLAPAADSVASLGHAIEEARAADLLLLSGGVSAGKYDFVEEALSRQGAQIFWTGVRIQPGKPVVIGEFPRLNARNSVRPLPFFGLPGNPLSSAVTFLLFAAPVLKALAGRNETQPHFAMAQIRTLVREYIKAGFTRFLPARCSFPDPFSTLPEVEALPWQGSGDLTALARANCFLVVPEDTSHLAPVPFARILLWE
jgi:molybdopterin molybdotransferase